MASKHKALTEQFRQLSQLIQIATQTADWDALKHHDLQLRELLACHKPYLNDPELATEIQRTKTIYANAFNSLENELSKLQQEMSLISAQLERAMAYQLAMTMESTE
ncbi:LafD [Vibrio hepatarius]|uniref:LafD n=1 Tax=Vibrio hepatarius TaxID=171383 RepID=UPI00142E0B19|nr:LafD [Vibrio hepatarius]NIY83656.1 LafD [Vibrio hepatarius]